jgi:hypothetical protein
MHHDRSYRKIPGVVLVGAVLASCLAGCNEGSSSEDQGGSGGGGGGRVRTACKMDIEKFCANEQHPKKCLVGHENALSSSCRTALEDRGNLK